MSFSTEKSWQKYKKSLEYLAGGSSTISKTPHLEKVEPALIVKGSGCRVWDLDGNEYIDFRNGLGPVTLGYCVPEINQAINGQLENGVVYGHPHPLEGEVAELLVDLIPCAERVRFLKTGGEAVAACIKIARHATKRNKILQCGYNGWLNNLSGRGYQPVGIAAGQPYKGVPPAIQALHRKLPWGDIEHWEKAFKKDGEDIAAVVIASSYADMESGYQFLPALRELTEMHGTLMIMDEIVTGFRLAIGGTHEYFDFMPDMAVFGKGLANGMPLSAYLGKAELLDSVKEISISSTFGGETLSLAAAKACIDFYQKNQVINYLWHIGKKLQNGVRELFRKYKVPGDLVGLPVCPVFRFESSEEDDKNWQELFFKTCYKNGVSLYNLPYVNYSHKEEDIQETLVKMEKAIQEIKSVY